MNTSLLRVLSHNWWLILLRGVLAIAFGVAAIAWPGLTLVMLVLLWGSFAGLDGLLSLIAAIKGGSPVPRWWLAVVGLLGICAFAACVLNPGMVGMMFVLFLGWVTILKGVFEIIGAIQLRKEIDNEWWLVLGGVVSIAIGLMFLLHPGAGALTMIWVISALSVAFGVVLILLSLRLRKHAHSPTRRSQRHD